MVEKLNPTNFYISLDAPNNEIHLKVNRPSVKNSWETINESISLLKEKKNNSVIRITFVKGHNDKYPELYAKILDNSEVDYVEVKAYMFIGGSRQRLSLENMPRHYEVREFADKIMENSSLYRYHDEQESSRVILLKKHK